MHVREVGTAYQPGGLAGGATSRGDLGFGMTSASLARDVCALGFGSIVSPFSVGVAWVVASLGVQRPMIFGRPMIKERKDFLVPPSRWMNMHRRMTTASKVPPRLDHGRVFF